MTMTNAIEATNRPKRRSQTHARRSLGDSQFIRRHGILAAAVLALILWTVAIWIISGAVSTRRTTKALTAKYDAEYETRMEAFKNELIEINTPTEDEVLERQIRKEADEIARAIGTMSSKRQKLSMLWNILMRVDSPYYPDTVSDVVNQPQQWMFYDSRNPVRDDDVNLALEQLRLWHAGRYPAGLSATFVYGEWSEHDYVLRDRWEKDYKTNYWRMPE